MKIWNLHKTWRKQAKRAHEDSIIWKWRVAVIVLTIFILLMSMFVWYAFFKTGYMVSAFITEIEIQQEIIDESHQMMSFKNDFISNMSEDTMELAIRISTLEKENEELRKYADECTYEYGILHSYTTPLLGQELEFLNIIEEVASERMYDAYEYNCVDFSKDNVIKLQDYGYAARILKITADCDADIFKNGNCEEFGGRHMISVVCLPLEGTPPLNTTGGAHIIPVWQYDDYGIKTRMLN